MHLFHCFDVCINMQTSICKHQTDVGETDGAWAWIETAAPRCASGSSGGRWIFHHDTCPLKKKKASFTKNVLDEAVQITSFIKFCPLSPCLLIFCVTEWEAWKKHCKKYEGDSRKSAYPIVWVASWTIMEHFAWKNRQASCSYSEFKL